jgi:hypothetical protein
MKIRTLVFGGAVGAAIAYFFDPAAGRGRRARFRDRFLSRARREAVEAGRRARHLTNRAQGAIAERVSPGPDNREPDDVTLAQRIHSTVLGAVDVPKDRLSLEVVDGVVTVRGELDSAETIADVLRRIEAVPGVRGAVDLLHLPGRPSPNKEEAIRASETAETTGRSSGSSSTRSFG